jgi:hypothetical protein
MSNQGRPLYSDLAAVLRYHGLFVVFFYLLFRLFGCFSLTRILLTLPVKCEWSWLADIHLRKSKPWWQDVVIFLFALSTISVICLCGSSYDALVYGLNLSWIGSLYILFDMVVYHTRVLWLDDLQPGRTAIANMVWSHRRVVLQAVINFTESIFLFSLFYRSCSTGGNDFWQSVAHSFSVATTLSPAGVEKCVTWPQICLSVFFLVVVISVVAASGYGREELAPSAAREQTDWNLPESKYS